MSFGRFRGGRVLEQVEVMAIEVSLGRLMEIVLAYFV
jgi:hypothetical protein